MEEKRLKQFTFYDLYYDALKRLPDEAAGRMAENICKFMFTNENIPEPQDDRENFFWSNIKDVLEEVKRIEESGRKPKNFNEKMPLLRLRYLRQGVETDDGCGKRTIYKGNLRVYVFRDGTEIKTARRYVFFVCEKETGIIPEKKIFGP